jgi:hypothetical protein
VNNEGDWHVYNVVVRFAGNIKQDLELLNWIKPDPGPKIQVGGLEFLFGMNIVEWQPKDGPPQSLLYISYLEPHTSYRIPVSISAPPDEDARGDRDIEISLNSFSTERKPLVLRKSPMFHGKTEALARIPLPNGSAVWVGFVTPAGQ